MQSLPTEPVTGRRSGSKKRRKIRGKHPVSTGIDPRTRDRALAPPSVPAQAAEVKSLVNVPPPPQFTQVTDMYCILAITMIAARNDSAGVEAELGMLTKSGLYSPDRSASAINSMRSDLAGVIGGEELHDATITGKPTA